MVDHTGITIKEIYWIAGILEGEACFTPHLKGSLRVVLEMNDLDVVRRFARFMDVPVRQGRPKLIKPRYIASVCGSRAAGLMMTIYPLMGCRRQAQIKKALDGWRCRKLNRSWKSVFFSDTDPVLQVA